MNDSLFCQKLCYEISVFETVQIFLAFIFHYDFFVFFGYLKILHFLFDYVEFINISQRWRLSLQYSSLTKTLFSFILFLFIFCYLFLSFIILVDHVLHESLDTSYFEVFILTLHYLFFFLLLAEIIFCLILSLFIRKMNSLRIYFLSLLWNRVSSSIIKIHFSQHYILKRTSHFKILWRSSTFLKAPSIFKTLLSTWYFFRNFIRPLTSNIWIRIQFWSQCSKSKFSISLKRMLFFIKVNKIVHKLKNVENCLIYSIALFKRFLVQFVNQFSRIFYIFRRKHPLLHIRQSLLNNSKEFIDSFCFEIPKENVFIYSVIDVEKLFFQFHRLQKWMVKSHQSQTHFEKLISKTIFLQRHSKKRLKFEVFNHVMKSVRINW